METSQSYIKYELNSDDSLIVTEKYSNGDCLHTKFSYDSSQDFSYGIEIVEIKDGDWTDSHYSLKKQEIMGVIGKRERVNKGSNQIEKIKFDPDLEHFMGIRFRLEEMLNGVSLPDWVLNHPVIVK